MFDYIISNSIFAEHVNVYGFLAEIVRSAGNLSYHALSTQISTYLKLEVENDHGPNLALSPILQKRINKSLIVPLFPIPGGNPHLISVDYIYAQAGSSFLRSGKIYSAYHSRDNATVTDKLNDDGYQSAELFDEYIVIGQAIEQLIIAEKMDESALRIFALPALLHYVYKEEENLRNKDMREILGDPDHWKSAFHLLFTYLGDNMQELQKARDIDPLHAFSSAVSNFENRTTLAEKTIREYCPSIGINVIKDAASDYWHNPTTYECRDENESISLPDIEKLFQNQKSDIMDKFHLYGIRSLPEEVGEAFMELMKNSNISLDQLLEPLSKQLRERINSSDSKQQIEEILKDLGLMPFPSDKWNKFKTANFKTSIRAALNIGGSVSIMEIVNFTNLVGKYMLTDHEIDISRLIDPGFELAFDVGKSGLESVESLIGTIGKDISVPFNATKQMLESCISSLARTSKKISEKFGTDVYVNSLSPKNGTGYGYKFIHLPDGKTVELRSVYEFEDEVPVVFNQTNDKEEQTCQVVDPKTGNIMGLIAHIKSNEMQLESFESFDLDVDIESAEEPEVCHPSRHRRSPPAGPSNCFRELLLENKLKAEEEAMEYVVNLKKLKFKDDYIRTEVRNELRKYVFPDGGKTELDFVTEWMAHKNLEKPSWIKQFEIDEHEMFFNLRYNKMLEDVEALTLDEAVRRISDLDPHRWNLQTSRRQIESVLDKYKDRGIYMHENFEDYYALFKYEWFGYSQMNRDQDFGRRVHMGALKVAVRQLDDPIDAFTSVLYRGEKRTMKDVDAMLKKGEYEVERLTSTSSVKESALKFARVMNGGGDSEKLEQVLYEMNFKGKYLRANIEDIGTTVLRESILLPGSKFKIIKVTKDLIDPKIGRYVKIEVTYEPVKTYELQQFAMAEIRKLKESGTRFHYTDIKPHIPEVTQQIQGANHNRKGFFSRLKSIFSKDRN